MAYTRRLLAIFLLLILHQNLFSSADAWGNVELTCKNAAAKGIDFHFCVKILQTIPKSSNAGTRDLAIAATKLAGKEFKHALNVVKKLLLTKVTDADKEALSVCSDAYGDGVDELKETITFIRSRSKFDAITYLSAALTDVTTCDDAFDDFGNKSLVAKTNANARSLTSLALAITSLL
ncbi:hypothetical protein HPP92_003936 [Vanilla planifolia]|uniref:Pectinesterase inhibitor domain-containing protein n=1 Tax=Vanilla planifolia TaxID=51239 RepID=A0A835VP40_VANPL|nr:hypothetical protein HPP92_004349 [Vanilla planifolia]KAG0499661.1 hypothetical protein HPP92_004352 [Vanilla planifolia]KAG0503861.1 hypothetical protein HPP92_003933 [Vanilla planifolia]KAG0503864.1 hypothetical protein HPP92_003936 [Vanilla planifolia]